MRVLFYDVPMLALRHVDVLTGFVHLAKNFDSLSLDLGKCTFFVFLLLVPNLLCAFCMVFFDAFFAVYKRGLEQVQSVVLHLLDYVLALIPLAVLLLFH